MIIKEYLTTSLLCAAIMLITLGIHANNLVFAGIGGFIAGVYNSIIYHKED